MMGQVQVFSTAGIAPRQRVEYWNELTGDALTQLVADPADPHSFSGRLVLAQVGEIRVAEICSDPATVRHSQQHIARAPDAKFFLCLQLEGVSVNRQQGREAVLRYGDFTLFDSSRPYEVTFGERNRMVVLCMGQSQLQRRMPHPEAVVAVPMLGDTALPGLLSGFLRHFWRECHSARDMPLGPRFSGAVLDLVASAYTQVTEALSPSTPLTVARRERVRGYIEAHLHDPKLTPTRVAEALGMSARYVHHLFNEGGETLARYILRRRLEECARALDDIAQRGHSATEIAFRHGFNDPSHFGRVFRERFGLTPSEYRRRDRDAAT
jgi:AraC family transcriptional activator of tynA and feaB